MAIARVTAGVKRSSMNDQRANRDEMRKKLMRYNSHMKMGRHRWVLNDEVSEI